MFNQKAYEQRTKKRNIKENKNKQKKAKKCTVITQVQVQHNAKTMGGHVCRNNSKLITTSKTDYD